MPAVAAIRNQSQSSALERAENTIPPSKLQSAYDKDMQKNARCDGLLGSARTTEVPSRNAIQKLLTAEIRIPFTVGTLPYCTSGRYRRFGHVMAPCRASARSSPTLYHSTMRRLPGAGILWHSLGVIEVRARQSTKRWEGRHP